MLNYKEFLNENNHYKGDQGKINGIKYFVDEYHIQNFEDYGYSVKEWIEDKKIELELETGDISYTTDQFKVKGKNKKGQEIHIDQKGEYNKYNGPYDIKMKKPLFEIDGVDVYPLVKHQFKIDEYIQDDNEADMTRLDLIKIDNLDDYMSMSETERSNYLRSISAVNKYNL